MVSSGVQRPPCPDRSWTTFPRQPWFLRAPCRRQRSVHRGLAPGGKDQLVPAKPRATARRPPRAQTQHQPSQSRSKAAGVTTLEVEGEAPPRHRRCPRIRHSKRYRTGMQNTYYRMLKRRAATTRKCARQALKQAGAGGTMRRAQTRKIHHGLLQSSSSRPRPVGRTLDHSDRRTHEMPRTEAVIFLGQGAEYCQILTRRRPPDQVTWKGRLRASRIA